MSLQLSLIAGNQQVTANLSWLGSQPSGVIDYIILYYAQGSGQINSISTQSLSVVISSLTNDTVYNFYAVAYQSGSSNGQRLSETTVQQAIPATLPSPPTNLQAIVSTNGNVISGEVQLSWNSSTTDSHYPILNYNVYQSSDNVNFSLIASPNALSYNVLNLQNGDTYYFAVSAVSILGEGTKCSSISAYPSGLASAPQNLLVKFDANASNSTQSGYQSVDLSWSAPSQTGGNAVTGYEIQYSLDQTFETGVTSVNHNTTTSDTVQSANLMTPFADLSTSTGWYFFRICAITSLGNGAFSGSSTILPTANADQVQNLQASNLNASGQHEAGCVTLSWSYKIDSSCPLLGYIITYLDADNNPQSLYIYQSAQSPSYTITGLQNGFQYMFNVMAFNILSIGESSNVSCTPSTIPDAPTLQITGHTSSSISMSYTTPSDEGSTITGFGIFRSTDNLNFSVIGTNIQTNTYTDSSNLVLGTTYYYQVCAINSNGNGLPSNTVSEYPSQIPTADITPTATATNTSSSGNQITVSWNINPNDLTQNGGSPITYFVLQRDQITSVHNITQTILGTVQATSSSSYQYIDNGVINGNTYAYRVWPANRDGQDSVYTESNQIIASGLPDSPQGLQVLTGNQQMTLSWTLLNVAPNSSPNDEGSAILHYKIYKDGNLLTTVASNINVYTDSASNQNGVVHSYQISAVNANGESTLSSSVSQSASTLPDIPIGLSATHGNSQVQLSWNLLSVAPNGFPSDEGRPIMLYSIYKSTDNINFNLAGTVSGSTNSYTVSGLTNGTTYYFEISATNIIGTSPVSSSISCIPSTSPSVPQSVTIYPYDSSVEISWEAPNNDAGGNPSGGLAYTYNIQISSSQGTAFQSSNIITPLINVTGLTDNQQYTLSLYANNGVDTNYNIYNATFTVLPISVPVSNLQVTSQSQQQINLQFTYETAMYSVNEFLLSVFDQTRVSTGYAIINASSQSIINGNVYTYNFALNSATVNIPSLLTSDRIILSMFAINSLGEVSPVSTIVTIN